MYTVLTLVLVAGVLFVAYRSYKRKNASTEGDGLSGSAPRKQSPLN